MGIRFYIGGSAATVGGERIDFSGYRCFTAAHSPKKIGRIQVDANEVIAMLDSGAFTDVVGNKRINPDQSLVRQLAWEQTFSEMCGTSWKAELIVSYDRLIDEKLIDGVRVKQRWSVQEADAAVAETIEAARYLASRRRELSPRGLVLACQGVDAGQYEECVNEVLKVATPCDAIGFGGWCILGRFKSWIPTFWESCWRTFPKIARTCAHVHIFGVLYEQALAPALWLADEFGIFLSVDSAAPLLACSWGNPKKAGVRASGAQANVDWWVERLRTLRQSPFYKMPSRLQYQQCLFQEAV